jgi:glutamyl-tRNA reductase
MQLLALGLNHTTAPLAVRERVAFSPDEITDTIAHLLERCGAASQGGIHEAAVLSTCNRTELYTACEDPAAARASVLSYIANKKGVPLSELEPHIYAFQQEEAARHTFRVASGLDSMVLGETQIVGQMKKAEKLAHDCRGLGVMLNHLFQSTFTVAKEVRTATAIGANSVSLAAAAVRLALRLWQSQR